MILKLSLFLIGFLLVISSFIYIHEVTHREIFSQYGLDSKVSFLSKECSSDALACTYPVGNYTLSKEEEISLNQTQSINEIVGYSLSIFLALNYCILFFLLTKDE